MRWFRVARSSGWATCPVTQAGFVRVSSNAKSIPGAVSPRDAFELLARIVRVPGHSFLGDDVDLASSDLLARERIHGHRQVTDAHLLAVAMRHDGRLATFDRGIVDLVPEGHAPEDVVVVLRATHPSRVG